MPPSRWSPLLVDASPPNTQVTIRPGTQSVAVHLVVLLPVIAEDQPITDAMALASAASVSRPCVGGYPKLEPVPSEWELTVADLVEAAASRSRRSSVVASGLLYAHGEVAAGSDLLMTVASTTSTTHS